MGSTTLFGSEEEPAWPLVAVESIYKVYPRKTGKPKALESIRKSLDRIAGGEVDGTTRSVEQSVTYLRDRTAAFAQAVSTRPPKSIPHPTTFYNQSRYIRRENLPLPKELATCKAILCEYPGIHVDDTNVDAFGDMLRLIEQEVEFLRPTHGPMAGKFLQWRVQTFASCVSIWPESEVRFIPNAKTFFSERRYMQDERFWSRTEQLSGYEADRAQAGRIHRPVGNA